VNLESTHQAGLARARISLEGLALGDAYGNHHAKNARKRAATIWEYSDDTLMALSIFANLRRNQQIDQDTLAKDFALRWNGNRGYGQGVTRLLKSIQRGSSWQDGTFAMFEGQGSYGNGAAMRSAPLGAYFAEDMEKLIEQTKLSAIVSHAHLEGIAGAVAVSVGAALAYQYKALKELPNRQKFLETVLFFLSPSDVQRKLFNASKLSDDTSVREAAKILGNGRPSIAQTTVPFALWMAAGYLSDFQMAIERTASAQGDVDTTCAIVGGIVACYVGIEGIPSEWVKRREPLPTWAFEE
jgi:ADP-ribosylglycohydrolase